METNFTNVRKVIIFYETDEEDSMTTELVYGEWGRNKIKFQPVYFEMFSFSEKCQDISFKSYGVI